MKNIIVILALCLCMNSFASICKSSHMEMAIKKSDQRLFNNSHKNAIAFGAAWGGSGIAYLSLGTLSFVAAGTGVFFIYKGIKGMIQEPKYRLIIRMLAAEKEEDYINLNKSRLFKRLMKKAKKIRPYMTEEELSLKFVEGIENGEFCKESGKPYTFQKMKREIFKTL